MASQNPNYCDAGTQTKWKGLTRGATIRPEALLSPPADAPTPPEDTAITEKRQLGMPVESSEAVVPSPEADQSLAPALSLLERRRNPSGLVGRIEMPVSSLNINEIPISSLQIDELSVLDDEVPQSPPPTHAVLSPLPAVNILHAGRTPPIPDLSLLLGRGEEDPMARQLSGKQQRPDEESGFITPQQDTSLTGPLILPANPMDGAEDTIGLEALDHVLANIAREQENHTPRDPQTETADEDLSLSRKGSGTSQRSSEDVQPVDGVILKSPPLNFGAPIGQI